MVAPTLGLARAERLDWPGARLVCVAGEVGAREEAVSRQLGGKGELIRIVRYGRGPFHIQQG